jgi:hypothetical protein
MTAPEASSWPSLTAPVASVAALTTPTGALVLADGLGRDDPGLFEALLTRAEVARDLVRVPPLGGNYDGHAFAMFWSVEGFSETSLVQMGSHKRASMAAGPRQLLEGHSSLHGAST